VPGDPVGAARPPLVYFYSSQCATRQRVLIRPPPVNKSSLLRAHRIVSHGKTAAATTGTTTTPVASRAPGQPHLSLSLALPLTPSPRAERDERLTASVTRSCRPQCICVRVSLPAPAINNSPSLLRSHLRPHPQAPPRLDFARCVHSCISPLLTSPLHTRGTADRESEPSQLGAAAAGLLRSVFRAGVAVRCSVASRAALEAEVEREEA
jgi:hypothetical protein